ncbi:DoxX family protein [Crenobacter sp. SG2303]|uniref:DoxX family protein n=1 Tax=Crenobacter oryzisoli TaxID=3056844 RepID=A0ABT7XJ32_9NEIS|nr:DoxX family protein [Crenobacter sp. SG2303]MDN0073800.1 DoxX family protein [Crenobacter sp. SG2303]
MDRLITIVSRILMAQIFVISGFGKLGAGYAATQGYMAHMGVPGFLLPLVILLELGGGLALAIGFQTRWIALLLAGFSILTALIFHTNLADHAQMINLMKNFAMAGGLLLLVRQAETQR